MQSTKPDIRASIHAPYMTRYLLATLILIFACQFVFAQQTNPVDRKVANPMTDTPNVNPLNTDQPVQRRPRPQGGVQGIATDEITCLLPQGRAGPDLKTRASSSTKETSTFASALTAFRPTKSRFTTLRTESSRKAASFSIRRISSESPARVASGTIAPRPVTSSTQPATQTRHRTARVFISPRIASRRSVSIRLSRRTCR